MSNNEPDTDQIFMMELKEEFMETIAVNLKDMAAFYKEKKFEEIAGIAHDIKGTAGIFGFDEGTEIAAQLLSAARDQEDEKIKDLIDRLKEYMKKNGLDI